ncbi:MAG: retropepsin-like aspartic protease [Terracidiphilus sp.]
MSPIAVSVFKFFACFVLATTPVPAISNAIHCPGNVASVPFRLINRYQIVLPVFINHAGPFDFLLDTGTDTTIVGPSLAAELHLRTQGSAVISGAGFHESGSFAQLDLLQAGSHAVANQEVLVYGLLNLHSLDPRIRGILGEDFLAHFDMLIDNGHKLLCLDDSAAMRAEVKGPHITLVAASQAPDAERLPGLLIVEARLSDGSQPIRLKLDSGTNAPFLYNTSGHMGPGAFGGGLVVGSGADGDEKVFSALPPQDVKIGSVRLASVTFMTLAHPLKNSGRKEFDGLLSIDLFRRVFINHADHYAVLEP